MQRIKSRGIMIAKIGILAMLWSNFLVAQNMIRTNNARIHFVSEAPLELIEATSTNCQGILNLENGDFAFRIFIKSFDGFNSPLQKEHFFENYMEVNQFPDATFTGKMVEQLPAEFSVKNLYRAKGNLKIHGINNEMIIPILLEENEDGLKFSAEFIVALEDHEIEIPAIVRQKIAEKIRVTVDGILK